MIGGGVTPPPRGRASLRGVPAVAVVAVRAGSVWVTLQLKGVYDTERGWDGGRTGGGGAKYVILR